MKINQRKLILYYEQINENIRFINTLLSDFSYRKKYCKKNSIKELCTSQLQRDLHRQYDAKNFIEMFIIKEEDEKFIVDEVGKKSCFK